MKKEMAKSYQLYSYMDRLLDDYNTSLSKTSVVSKFYIRSLCVGRNK